MARTPRLQLPFTPSQRVGLARARKELGLATDVDAAMHLITEPLAKYITGDNGSSGFHLESNREPPGIQSDSNRIPPDHSYINNNNPGKGESEREGTAGGVQSDSTLPLRQDEPTEIDRCLSLLGAITGWPFDIGKDAKLLAKLIALYPKADPVKVIKRLEISAIDNPLQSRGARQRLTTYMSKAESFSQTRQKAPPKKHDEDPTEGFSADGIDTGDS